MKLAESLRPTLSKPERRYDLDWLRVLAVLLLVYFHTLMIFSPLEGWYVKNNLLNGELELFIRFIHQWHMPLFFTIAGAATWFALGFRTAGQYVAERFKRLFIPLIFGILVIVPPQFYYQLLRQPGYGSSYLQFYLHFFEQGTFDCAHLWFIKFLLTFSLITLPLFLHLRKAPLQERLPFRLICFCEGGGAIFLLAIPLAMIDVALRARYSDFVGGWANFCFYLTFFIYGYLLFADPRFGQAVEKHGRIALGLGIVSMSVYLGLFLTGNAPANDYSMGYVLYQILHSFNAWFWVIALLGLGRRHLNFNNKILQYANEAAYPFYIIHQTVIVFIAFYAVQWNIGVTEKILWISTATLVVTIALYDLFVKRSSLMRFLFGMNSKKTPPYSQKRFCPVKEIFLAFYRMLTIKRQRF